MQFSTSTGGADGRRCAAGAGAVPMWGREEINDGTSNGLHSSNSIPAFKSHDVMHIEFRDGVMNIEFRKHVSIRK